jgi:hypothetical protein
MYGAGTAGTNNGVGCYFDNGLLRFHLTGNTFSASAPQVTTGAILQTTWGYSTANGRQMDLNGTQLGTETTKIANIAAATGRIGLDWAGSNYFDGDIAEILLFAADNTLADKHKIETYLFLKYGITGTHDYISSNGTTIWDVGGSGGFDNDIAGIGRDAALHQKQATAMNLDDIITIGNGSIATLTNRMPQNFTLLESFRDDLPTGLILATGSNTGTCNGVVSFSEGDTALTVAAGTVLSSGSCTIVVPVKSNQAGVYCNTIYMNALLGMTGTMMIGNEDLATSCLTVQNTPCTNLTNPLIQMNRVGTIGLGDTLILTAVATGLNDYSRLNWNATGGKFLNTGSNPTYWIAPQVAGHYSFTVQLDNDATGYGTCLNNASASQQVIEVCPMICLPVHVVRN